MKQKLTGNPNEELITLLGKKLPDPARFRSVISLHKKVASSSSDKAADYAKEAIALALGVHTGELKAADIKQCKSVLDKALKINSELPVVKIAEGCYYYYCKKHYEKAISSFTEASEKDPKNYKPLFYLTMVNKATGNWKEVQSLLKKIIKFKISNPLGLTNIGICFEYLHDFASAVDFHQRAMNIKPEWEAAYFNKVRALLLKNDDTSEPRKLLESIIDSENEYLEYQIILDIYDGDYSGAFEKTWKAKNKYFPLKWARYVYLGNISALKNEQENSEKFFKTALRKLKPELEANPTDADLRSLKGLAHAGKGEKTEAVAEGKKAVSYAKKSNDKILENELILNLAKIYSTLGMKTEAIETIEEVLKRPSLFSTKVLKHDPVWKPLLNEDKLIAITNKYDKVLTL